MHELVLLALNVAKLYVQYCDLMSSFAILAVDSDGSLCTDCVWHAILAEDKFTVNVYGIIIIQQGRF